MSNPVVVVGGGVIGCAVAYELLYAGVSVRLLERDRGAGEATGHLTNFDEPPSIARFGSV